jgi:hypothetical protein
MASGAISFPAATLDGKRSKKRCIRHLQPKAYRSRLLAPPTKAVEKIRGYHQ